MNKKLMVFGFMAFFAIAITTAGLVNYLSETSDVDLSVSSPIYISEITGDDLSGVYGGENRTISAEFINLADAQIKGKVKIVISNEGITLDDFDLLTAGIVEYVNGVEVYSIDNIDMKTEAGFVESIIEETNQITFITTERTFEITETWNADFTLGFKSNVEGDYNFEVTVIPL